MPTLFPTQDLVAIAPMALVAIVGCAVLLIDALKEKSESVTGWLSIAALVVAGILSYLQIGDEGSAFSGAVFTGGTSAFFGAVFSLAGILSLMLSRSYIAREGIEHGEYYVLILFSVCGMMLMAGAATLVTFFIGLELMSVCFYVLTGFARKRISSNESAIKYFLLGAFATGFVLYGIALVYGTTGTTEIGAITAKVAATGAPTVLLVGIGLLMIGLSFKVAAVPFHMWVPDVYEGAPTTVTAFMSTGGKAAAFSVFLLLFGPQLLTPLVGVREVLAVLAALTMVVGNIIALAQSSIKRMLAYSSIAHAGYILTGIIAANSFGTGGVAYYLAAYTVMNVGAFGILSVLETENGKGLTFDEYTGLASAHPLLAGLMALFMFALAGIPPFAGFFGKYYVFAGAIQAGYTWLAIVGVVMSIVSAYYYLRLVVVMYFKPSPGGEPAVPAAPLAVAALILSAIAVVLLGLFPSTVLALTAVIF